jgi:glycopeptide antibiotics resistance protein
MPRLIRLSLVWLLIVWVVSFPWIGFTPVPQWHRIHWLPFTDPADRFRDFFSNILLFFPFGYLVARRRAGRRGVLIALGMSLAISVSAEAMQLFSTLRHPSATDITAAILGTLAGGATTLYLHAPSKPETWTD